MIAVGSFTTTHSDMPGKAPHMALRGKPGPPIHVRIPDDLYNAARTAAGMPENASGTEVVRYSMARAAGYGHHEALAWATGLNPDTIRQLASPGTTRT